MVRHRKRTRCDRLATLRSECGRLVAERDAEMTRLGVDTLDLCHRGRRYFLHAYATSPAVRRFLFSDRMADIAEAVLGDNVYLFNEQYVIKAAERGMSFGWHQDSGFIPYPHRPYLTCWIPLDDVSEVQRHGAPVALLAAGTRDVVEHHRDHDTNDMIGYAGQDPGDPLTVPAGSIVAFSSTLLHRTGPNTSDQPRRVTSRSTPPSHSSTKTAHDPDTSPSRSSPPAVGPPSRNHRISDLADKFRARGARLRIATGRVSHNDAPARPARAPQRRLRGRSRRCALLPTPTTLRSGHHREPTGGQWAVPSGHQLVAGSATSVSETDESSLHPWALVGAGGASNQVTARFLPPTP